MNRKENNFNRKYSLISSRKNPDGQIIFYGVKTTGVFCKSGCPSRLPRPENVLFFKTTGEALKSGFRPCKRCNPLKEGVNDQTELIIRICRIIEQSDDSVTLNDLAKKTGYSEGHVQRIFKKNTGISPKEYGTAIRTERFRRELHDTSDIISSIYQAGFGSSSRVYENVDNILAMSPSQFRNSGKNVHIRIGVYSSLQGLVLIALTERGVAAIDLGDDKQRLIREFKTRFKNSTISPCTGEDNKTVQAVLKKIEDPYCDIAIPLDIQGTIFQKRVWNALTAIPAGETRTYSDIASDIGKPQSIRAVANACAKNKLAIVIPCHRVVKKNGDSGGYRWGKEKKEKLLMHERNEKIKNNESET